MPEPTIILQPTAEELIKFFSISAEDSSTSIKLTVEITKKSELTLKEAAKYIDRSEISMRKYINKNLIPSTKYGNKRLFKIEDLNNFIETGGNC